MSKLRPELDMQDVAYTPTRLLNALRERLGAERNADIAWHLRVDQAMICHFSKRRYPLTPTLVLRIMEATGMTLDEVRKLSGVQTWMPSERRARSEKLENV